MERYPLGIRYLHCIVVERTSLAGLDMTLCIYCMHRQKPLTAACCNPSKPLVDVRCQAEKTQRGQRSTPGWL